VRRAVWTNPRHGIDCPAPSSRRWNMITSSLGTSMKKPGSLAGRGHGMLCLAWDTEHKLSHVTPVHFCDIANRPECSPAV
jgi:hypothetical protein